MLEGIASSSNHTAVPFERIAERIKCGHVQASTFAVETLQSLTPTLRWARARRWGQMRQKVTTKLLVSLLGHYGIILWDLS